MQGRLVPSINVLMIFDTVRWLRESEAALSTVHDNAVSFGEAGASLRTSARTCVDPQIVGTLKHLRDAFDSMSWPVHLSQGH